MPGVQRSAFLGAYYLFGVGAVVLADGGVMTSHRVKIMSIVNIALAAIMLSIGFFVGFVTNSLVSGAKIIELDEEVADLRAKILHIQKDEGRLTR